MAPAVNLAPTATRGVGSAVSEETTEALRELLERRKVNFSLEAPFYTDSGIFRADMEGIFEKYWLFAASLAEIPEPGDYVTVEFGPYALVLVRNDEGGVNALHNVCRHRGAKVLREKSGTTGNLVCGYHSWTYAPDGTLLHAAATGDNFDKDCFGLKKAHVRIVAGLVYVCLAENPPEDFDEMAQDFEEFFEPYELEHTKIAYQQDIIENANWKLVMENNRECYHCDGHPELACALFPTQGQEKEDLPPHYWDQYDRERAAEVEMFSKRERHGYRYDNVEGKLGRTTGYRIDCTALDGAGESFSPDGSRLVKKLIGEIPEFKLGRCGMHTQPNGWSHWLGDHAITFAVFPISENQTLVRTIWHVAEDAVEGVDYDLDALTNTWKNTNIQDREFVELCQAGASSPAYEQGPYMKSEWMVEAFIDWYVQRMREHVA
ncbi:aromatic ring-hydroxylating oxygenase subunit alpha [Leucobacter sp. GX24907]|jgi:Rieske 2Fe-2S family protein